MSATTKDQSTLLRHWNFFLFFTSEGFLQENDLLVALAELPVELKSQMGYTREELLIDCKYKGMPCNARYRRLENMCCVLKNIKEE